MAVIGGCVILSATPGATVTLTLDVEATRMVAIWTAGENETINLSGTQKQGQFLTLMVTDDAVIRTLTFGTGFSSSGVAIGTALKRSTHLFQSDGTNFVELSRTLGL